MQPIRTIWILLEDHKGPFPLSLLKLPQAVQDKKSKFSLYIV